MVDRFRKAGGTCQRGTMNLLFGRIFISQAVLEEWSIGEQLILDEHNVATLTPSEWRYRLLPAMHISMCLTGEDPRDLVGKVKLEEDLREAGGELAMGTVVLGDDAYEGTSGFLAQRLGDPGANDPRLRTGELNALNDAFLGRA
jgi:hypothetical protein